MTTYPASRALSYNLSSMNSHARSELAPDRIDPRMGHRPVTDARMEGISVPFDGATGRGGPTKDLNPSDMIGLVKKQVLPDGTDKFDIPQRFTKSGRKKAIPFPLKLMKVLSQEEYTHIITWLPDGKSFTVVRPKDFVTEILPDFFKRAKYSSFTRKLHRWGFQRHLRGEDAGAFFHKLFLRGRLDLVEKMTCHKADITAMEMKQLGSSASAGGVMFHDPMLRGTVPNNPNLGSHQTQLRLQQQLQQLQLMQQQLQSLQQQQQQNMTIHQQHEQLDLMRMPSGQPMQGSPRFENRDPNSVDRLNAAMELERSRRMNGQMQVPNERFMQQSMQMYNNQDRLALSRQALAMNLGMPTQTPQFGTGSQFSTGPFQGLQNLLGKDYSNFNEGVFSDFSHDDQMHFNPQGARTA